MAKKTSSLEDIIDIASLLPWKICLVLAVVSYFALHHFSMMELPKTASMADMQPFFYRSLGKNLAGFGQYIFPFAFLMAGFISFFRQKKRSQLIGSRVGSAHQYLQEVNKNRKAISA